VVSAKPYNTDSPLSMEWTKKALELLNAGKISVEVINQKGVRIVEVDGICPYCEDPLHYTDSLTAVTEGSPGDLPEGGDGVGDGGPTYEELTVTCGCGEQHAGDPKKGTGCGTSFRVSVLVS
jgi:hypothetical protein